MNNPENLALCYLRLNGYFTIANFVLHPDSRGPQRTDADILAVRFPYSTEQTMPDDPLITSSLYPDERLDRICLLLGEVKTSLCNINEAWLEASKQNIHRAVMRLGIAEGYERQSQISERLYEQALWCDDTYLIRRVTFGAETNPALPEGFIQVTWRQIAEFIYSRFNKYHRIKADHSQWDQFMKTLYAKATNRSTDEEAFRLWIQGHVL